MTQATLELSRPSDTAAPSLLKGAFFAALALVLLTCLLGGLYARQDQRERSGAVAPAPGATLPRG